MERAHAAGIPVFTFDVQVTDETARELVVAHIGSDNHQGGRLAGKSMMEVTREVAKGTVELLLRNFEGEEIPRQTFTPYAHYRHADSVTDQSRIDEQW